MRLAPITLALGVAMTTPETAPAQRAASAGSPTSTPTSSAAVGATNEDVAAARAALAAYEAALEPPRHARARRAVRR